jgi:hypothetical protein
MTIFIFLIGSMRAILSKMEAYAYFMVLDIKGIVNLWTKVFTWIAQTEIPTDIIY